MKKFFPNAPQLLLGAFLLFGQTEARELLEPESDEIRFLSYNLKNYLTMEFYRKGGVKTKRTKPEEEKAPLVRIISSANPHILGVSEIGTKEDLADLQERLKSAGVDLPHAHHTGGADKTRKLGLLSSFPLKASNSQ